MNKGLSYEKLHLIAMILMLIDHVGLVLYPSLMWMRYIGRLAFPIFCFMLVEGYYHTSNNKKYIGRLLLSALISEIPFDLMLSNSWIGIYQNVMWTLMIGLISISLIEKIKGLKGKVLSIVLQIITIAIGYVLGQIFIVDYYGIGVVQVLVFYYGRGSSLYKKAIQLIGLICINYIVLGGYFIKIWGFEVPTQAFAILALLIIWAYNNKKELSGLKSKIFKYTCYVFYPIHMLVIYFIYKMILG